MGNKKKCGIMMPITLQKFGAIEYSESYWASLLEFLKDAISGAGYDPQPVWDDELNATVTRRIIENIETYPLAICVVSSFNPNVMIELGMRLFANKPVLVLLDENTSCAPFDIKDLEYYKYPTRPLYKQYPVIKKEIGKFLKKMARSGYKNFKDNFSPRVSEASAEMKEGVSRILNRDISLKNDLSGVMHACQAPSCSGPEYVGPTGPGPSFDYLTYWDQLCSAENQKQGAKGSRK